jgi:hypothetical protein
VILYVSPIIVAEACYTPTSFDRDFDKLKGMTRFEPPV